MVVSGVPRTNGIRHAGEIATLSLDLLSMTQSFKIPHLPDKKLMLRIGLHSGETCLPCLPCLRAETEGCRGLPATHESRSFLKVVRHFSVKAQKLLVWILKVLRELTKKS